MTTTPAGSSLLQDPGSPAPTATSLDRWWRVAAAAVVGAVLVLAYRVGGPLWFYADDWNSLDKYADGSLFDPFNGHLTLVPAAVFSALYHWIGVGSYTPYRLLGLVAVAGLAVLLFRYVASRAGGAVALVTVALVVWSSAAASNLLFPFLFNFTVPMAALVAIWWHLDRRTTRDDVAASAWLAVALASSGLGVVAMAAVAAELLVERAAPRRWFTMAAGPLLWFAWYVAHRDAGELSTDIPAVARYGWEMLLGATTALAAGWRPGGYVLLVAGAAAFALGLRRTGRLEGRVAAAAVAPVVFVVLTSLSRVETFPAIPPDELRYAWTVSVYLLLLAVALWPRPDPASTRAPRRRSWIDAVAFGVVCGVVVSGGVQLHRSMHRWTDMATGSSPGIRTALFVTEALGPRRAEPDMVLPLSFVPVTTADYLGAVDAVGSPVRGVTAAQLGGDGAARDLADRRLVDRLPVQVVALPAGGGECTGPAQDVARVRPGTHVDVAVPPGAGPTSARIGRFSRDGVELGPLGPGRHRVSIPDDLGPRDASGPDYVLRVDGPAAVHTCA